MMPFRILPAVLVTLLVQLSCGLGAVPDVTIAKPPNIILIVVDDFGYECVGANGGTSYKTPVLDELASKGVRFEHCYAQPLCTPTRVQLMTGQYNVRNYLQFGSMDPKLKTFGNALKDSGYATCVAGKWQLGKDAELPKKFGFDEHCLWQHTRRPSRYRNPGLEINGRQVDYTQGEYGPDIVNEYALDFIRRKQAASPASGHTAPFFLYYPMMLTHAPFEPTPESLTYDGVRTQGKRGRRRAGKERHFADMVEYADKLVGKLVAHLDELRIRENTLLLLIGDNGTGAGVRSMMGDRVVIGAKGKTVNAGMHVPLIASWPAQMASGKVCADLIDTTDFLPTICEAAGVQLPSEWQIDGRSFLPQLRGENGQSRDWYYCWYAPRGRLITEFAATTRYKLYRNGNFYDLSRDTEELQALKIDSLRGEGAAAVQLLQGALQRYRDARPSAPRDPTENARNAGQTATEEDR